MLISCPGFVFATKTWDGKQTSECLWPPQPTGPETVPQQKSSASLTPWKFPGSRWWRTRWESKSIFQLWLQESTFELVFTCCTKSWFLDRILVDGEFFGVGRITWPFGIQTTDVCWVASMCHIDWSQRQNQPPSRRYWRHFVSSKSEVNMFFITGSSCWSSDDFEAQVGDDAMKSSRVALPKLIPPLEMEHRVSGRTGNFAVGSPEEAWNHPGSQS